MIFLHSDTISHKNGCGHGQKWAWWKMGMASLKLTVFEELADGIDKLVFCMLHFYTWLQKLKAAPKFFRGGWSKMGVISLVTGLKKEQME